MRIVWDIFKLFFFLTFCELPMPLLNFVIVKYIIRGECKGLNLNASGGGEVLLWEGGAHALGWKGTLPGRGVSSLAMLLKAAEVGFFCFRLLKAVRVSLGLKSTSYCECTLN